MQNHQLPPPPPQGFAPAPQGFSQPPAAPPQAAFAAPPQGFAAPAPQGFSQPQQVPGSSLNGVTVSDINLLPAININGTTKLRVTAYVKGNRGSGPAYTASLLVMSGTVQEMQPGTTFSLLCKISYDPRNQSGEKTRKRFVAACYGQNVNAAIDWDAADAALQARDFQAQPIYLELDQRVNYSRPVLDKTTKQPLPNQWWSDNTWRLGQA